MNDTNAGLRNKLISIAPYVAVVVAAVPLLLWRDFTPDNELRYLSIADEALREGHYWTFYNHGLVYADKPPLYLWIVMAARALCGTHSMAVLALFSLIPALLTARITSRWLGSGLSARWKTAASWMLLTSAFYFGLAVTLRMDMLLTLFILLALRSCCRIIDTPPDRRPSRRELWLLPVWVFAAVFSKGPFGLLIPLIGSSVYALWVHRMRGWGRAWGWRTWLVLIALCAVWFGAVWTEGGRSYLDNLLLHQTVDRAVNAFHHQRPIYYYAIAIWYVLAPWSLLELAAIVEGRRSDRTDLRRVCASVVCATFVMLSLTSSKIQVYLLPLIPFAVYWAARALPSCCNRLLVRLALGVPAIVLIAALPAYLVLKERMALLPDSGLICAGAAVLSAGGVAAIIALMRRRMAGAIALIGSAIMGAVVCIGFALPQINPQLGYGPIVRSAARQPESRQGVAVWRVPRGENIDAYLRGRVRVIPDSSSPRQAGRGVLICPTAAADTIPGASRRATAGNYSVIIISEV